MASSAFTRQKLLAATFKMIMLLILPAFALLAPSPAISFAPDIASKQLALSTSHNWAGYNATGGTFTSITGTWTIPQVQGGPSNATDATWIGIGGAVSRDLIQSGTQDQISRTGHVIHTPFFEMLPSAAEPLPVTIRAGDTVTVTITETARNRWRVSFVNVSNGQSYVLTVVYTSSLSSAEWIEEAPSSNSRILPLDDFGIVSFRNGTTVEGRHSVSIAGCNAQPIAMINGHGDTLASPSFLNYNGTGFSVTRTNASA